MSSVAQRNCVVSAWTSDGAFVVTTRDSALVGISYLGSAAAGTIQIFKGTSTGGSKVAVFNVPITSGGFETTRIPIVCSGGICATNVGTVAGYAVLYTQL